MYIWENPKIARMQEKANCIRVQVALLHAYASCHQKELNFKFFDTICENINECCNGIMAEDSRKESD